MGTEIIIKENIEYICRTCLSTDGSLQDMVELFDSMTDTVANMYVVCTSLPASISDGLSEYICAGCYKSLVDFHTFRSSCIDSYNFLIQRKAENKMTPKTDSENSLWTDPAIKQEQPVLVESTMGVYDDFTFAFDNETKDSLGQSDADVEKDSMDEDVKSGKKRTKQDDYKSNSPGRSMMFCDICQKIFFRKDRLRGHLRKHAGEKQYKCNYEGCDRSYFMKSTLQNHEKIKHLGQAKKVRRPVRTSCFVCEHCGKAFKTNDGLKKHRFSHMPDSKMFKCSICPKAFAIEYSLKEHMMRHDGIKNYVCSLCGLRKTTKQELKRHMNFHTKEKQYPCEVCGKVFYAINKKTEHVKVVHRGVKNYKCTHCDKSFARPETLKFHTMTHTGKKLSG